MLPPRSVLVARVCAGAFGIAAALSLWNGTSEWTAAFRGLAAATACAILVPPLYKPVERAWNEAAARIAAETDGAAPLSTSAPPKGGGARR